ncbi:SDR family NAD(P)-dependent oxidoreductase [Pseudonocardia sp. TRM90224]|uniref:SDR family NAD(P)-dependent oxidoreductase n=1 Tax=Pseudonocardia sp. TRM90224 TaxID=2812678 RepID=UPI0027DF743E|nr:SDR family NAD(P)-dependent oxidoreductase [Pseudonocardia sp. TRM90224]
MTEPSPSARRGQDLRPVALITGASRGVGAAVARALAPSHDLLLGGRDTAALAALAAELPGSRPWPIELTDTVEVVEATGGIDRLDALVHSAAVVAPGTVADTKAAVWRRHFDVNVVAVAELTRLLLPALRAACGRVVILNPGTDLRGQPGWASLVACSQALSGFAEVLRAEEGPRVRVTSIHAGHLGAPAEPDAVLRPESIAGAVLLSVTAPDDAVLSDMVLHPAARTTSDPFAVVDRETSDFRRTLPAQHAATVERGSVRTGEQR